MRKTCAECPHLGLNKTPQMALAYCTETDLVIPQNTERKGKEWEITYWRVPRSCPLPDGEVHKSEDKAPQKDWVVKTIDA